MKNKKGSMIDIIIYSIIIFALALVIIFGYKIMNTFNTEFQGNEDLSSNAKSIISDSQGRYIDLFDGIFLTVFILLAIAIAIGAYFVYLHPVFFVPALFISIFVIIIAGVLVNAFSDISTDPELSSERGDFTFLPFIMGSVDNPKGYLLPFIVVFTFLVIIASYAKYKVDTA